MRSTSGVPATAAAARSDPISAAEKVRTPRRSSTRAATASFQPMRPVPRTQPMRAATRRDVAAPAVVLAALAAEDHLEGGLGLPVDAVAAERALVG